MKSVDIRTVQLGATELIAVCRKCGKRAGSGFGVDGQKPLAKALRQVLGTGKGKRATVRIVETACMGLCPKRAVVVARGSAPGALLIVPAGSDVASVAAALSLPVASCEIGLAKATRPTA